MRVADVAARAPAAGRVAGHGLAVAVAVALAGFAFLYRFNALGGSLGGFDNDDFFVLTRADMILDGYRPLRHFAESELRGAWPSLTYALPAWAQMAWGRHLLANAYLCVGALAACAGIVFLLARDLSRGWLVPLLAAATVIVSGTKLYNYPKVLALTIGAVLIRWVMGAPSPVRLMVLAAWTVVAGLFRHDLAVYLGIATVVGLVARQPRPVAVPVRWIATYAGAGLLFAAPTLMAVAADWGLGRYVADALTTMQAEGRRLVQWPVVRLSAPLDASSLVAFTYYVFWLMPALALLVARAGAHGPPAENDRSRQLARGVGAALMAMAPVANYFFLRANLPARFGDAVVPIVLLAAWMAGAAGGWRTATARALGLAVPALLLALMFGSFLQVNSIRQELTTGGITISPQAAAQRLQYVRQVLRGLPPVEWVGHNDAGALAVARYVAECTSPTDHVLIGTYADFVAYFARRHFAAGQGVFAHGLYVTERDQRLALERLGRQSVPVAITSPRYEDFAKDYPLVARHVSERYADMGVVTAEGAPFVRVLVDKTRQPRRTDPVLGLPCFQ